ncbi:aminoglycoside adenylyltransferase family protein [Massilia sp. METH4]|uniref:aminoglycoside adenylyltransferase family protein n=1 Tax=Massilia sp. METH4 TaxID=3123041 RepID=UPI0030D25770
MAGQAVPPLSLPATAVAQLAAARAVLEHRLGDRLVAIYLFGSAVEGGLQPRSDLDLLVAVGEPLDEPTRHGVMTELLDVSAPPGAGSALRALEVTVVAIGAVVPWRYPAIRELQFGEWLRDDLRAGRFEPPVRDHDLAILLTKVRGHGIPLHGPPAATVFEPVPPGDLARALGDTLAQWNEEADWRGDECHIALALARIWYTAGTGRIAGKAQAAAWALERLPPELRPLLAAARSAYLDGDGAGLGGHEARLAALVAHVRTRVAAGEGGGGI